MLGYGGGPPYLLQQQALQQQVMLNLLSASASGMQMPKILPPQLQQHVYGVPPPHPAPPMRPGSLDTMMGPMVGMCGGAIMSGEDVMLGGGPVGGGGPIMGGVGGVGGLGGVGGVGSVGGVGAARGSRAGPAGRPDVHEQMAAMLTAIGPISPTWTPPALWSVPPRTMADQVAGWACSAMPQPSQPTQPPGPSYASEFACASSPASVSALAARNVAPQRPGHGKRGRPTTLLTNFAPLHVKEVEIFKYDVSFAPEMKTAQVRRHILSEFAPQIEKLRDEPTAWAYDGDRVMYVVGSLGEMTELRQSTPSHAAISSRVRPVVTLREVGQLDLGRLRLATAASGCSDETIRPMMHVLDTVLKQHNSTFCRSVGPAVFDPDDISMHKLLGRPMASDTELWFGHRQTVVLTDTGPMLQIDLAATAMLAPMSVVDFVAQKLGVNAADMYLNPEQLAMAGRQLTGKQVRSSHNERRWRIRGIASESATASAFVNEVETRISVADYFEQQYGIVLKLPHLPCLKVGRTLDPVEIPMELCHFLPGQAKRDLTLEHKVAMMKETCTPPPLRLEKLNKIVSSIQTNDQISRTFGVDVDPSGLSPITGRVLDPLQLLYTDARGRGVAVDPDGWRGRWNMRSRSGNDLQLAQPCARVDNWVVVTFCPVAYVRPQQLDAFLRQLVYMAGQRGMSIGRPLEVLEGSPSENVEILLQGCFNRYAALSRPLQFVFCVIPDQGNSTYLYPTIKRWANTGGGVPSQCVQAGKLLDRQKYGVVYVSNLLLKLNLKLGGQNAHPSPVGCTLVQGTPTIVLGADVYHSPPGSDRLSFAAVCATMDRNLATYHTLVESQPSRCEVVEKMEEMMVKQLRRFYELNGQLVPRRIIFYRDGVGHSQFSIIKEREIAAIRRACTIVGGDQYTPELVFIVVQKRNHCRLFREAANGTIENAPPGTVIDTVITTPSQFDFYMCSHYGVLGTSRPTHYHVLNDDVSLSADEIQRFTFDMCHLFGRCNAIVSSPAPTHYAHLAAYQAHFYMHNFREESFYNGNGQLAVPLQTEPQYFCRVKPHLEDRLYFC